MFGEKHRSDRIPVPGLRNERHRGPNRSETMRAGSTVFFLGGPWPPDRPFRFAFPVSDHDRRLERDFFRLFRCMVPLLLSGLFFQFTQFSFFFSQLFS